VIEVGEDGSMRGFLSPLWNTFTDSLAAVFGNVTIFAGGMLGDVAQNSGKLTGCMGRLQRNESDIASPFIEYPIITRGIRQSTFMTPTKMMIVSTYNNNMPQSETDVMDAFHSLSRSLWTITAFTAMFLTGFILIGMNISIPAVKVYKWQPSKGSISLSIRIAMGNVLKQHSSYNYQTQHHYQRLLVGLFAVFSFLMIFYFSSMIKTEMVIQKDPVTITTYDEILERKVQPFFAELVNDHTEFKYANPGSKAGKIWQLANKYGIENCMISSDAQVPRLISLWTQQKAVWLGSLYVTDLFRKNICPIARKVDLYNSIFPLMTSDQTSREKIVGLPLSASTSPRISKRYLRLTTSFLEMGIVTKMINLVESPSTGSKEVVDCLSNKIIQPDHEFHAVKLPHYEQLFVISAYLLGAFTVLLLCEVTFCKCKFIMQQKKVTKSRRPVTAPAIISCNRVQNRHATNRNVGRSIALTK
jgi:hypothetical protein